MTEKILSKDELIDEINILKIQNADLKKELNFYKENNKIKENYQIDYIHIEAILDAIPSAVVIVNAVEGKFTYLNKRAVDLYGINYLGFDLDSHIAKVKALALDGTPYPLDEMPISYSLKYGQQVRNKYMIIERADGIQIPVMVSSSPIFNDKGTVTSVIVTFEDVTGLKLVEKALKESEEMMKSILENSCDCISMYDLKTGKYLYISPSKVEMTGFTVDEFNNFTAEESYERMHPNDRDNFTKLHELSLTGIEDFEYDKFRWKIKNGEYRWYEDRRKIVRDKDGQPYALVAISRDITEQIEYENKLALQGKILSNVNDAIIVLDEFERITYCNKAYVELFGWEEQELVGNQFFDFGKGYADEYSKAKLLWTLDERLNAERSTYAESHWDAIKCYTKDGTEKIIDISGAIIKDSEGEYKGLIYSIRDVSEKYEYQLELIKSEEKYRYLYNSIDEGLAIIEVIFDEKNKPVDFRYIELNPAYEKQTGLVNEKILGKTAKELKFDFDDFWYETYSKVALTGESIRFVNEEKSLNMWADVYVFKIDLEKGNKVGVLFNNITEKVLHNQKLEELIKMQDELYVNVSHELKTPLNVIFSANQLMDIYLKNNQMETERDKLINYNYSIKQNCYRLTRLINNIVDLSKSNSGILMLNLVNVDIVEVIKNIVQSVSEYIKSKKLRIIFDTNVEEKIIACDPDKIERVMLNLISNAIKFSKPNCEISINVICKENTVEISVKDTGTGIEKQNLDYIFNKFYQENKSLSRNAEGNGIGLALTKSFVEQHGGIISVESEVNKGSIFKVEIPARTMESQELREVPNPYRDKIETIKIEFSDIYSFS
ncbi:MAG: histidine kinase [Sedimentibacter sp.]|jgi:PAS domain S-box-containing protein|nr:histidine kinase [Sedimentibacter sp.]